MLNISSNTDSFATKAMAPAAGEVAVADWFQKVSANTGAIRRSWSKYLDGNPSPWFRKINNGTNTAYFLYARTRGIQTTEWTPLVNYSNDNVIGTVRVTVYINTTFVGSLSWVAANSTTVLNAMFNSFLYNLPDTSTMPEQSINPGTIYVTVSSGDASSYIQCQQLWVLEY